MNSQDSIPVRSRDLPPAYRLMRTVIRFGLRLLFPRLRLLNQERLAQPGPAILVIAYPRALPAALLLISALDRHVRCLLPSTEFRGLFGKLAAWALGMQAFDFTSEEQDSWLNACLTVLANQGVIALFAGRASQDNSHCAPVAGFAARLSVEATLRGQNHVQPAIYPVHWFFGRGRRGPESLVCIDSPMLAQDFLPKVGEDLAAASLNLVETVQASMVANIFGLAEPELKNFNQELEGLLRAHLKQQWSHRPDWKQRPEDLHLSSFARKWVTEQNRMDPARLVELRESLDAYRETHRQCSMEELIVETSGPWQASKPRLAAAWFETLLGFPIALYGLINHLPALIILSASGLLRNSPRRDPKVEWLLRIFTVLSSYTLQIFVVHFWWGRAAAGYYALTLPVSGAYLWRYHWLVRRRVHVLFRKVLHPTRSARVARVREDILGSFNRELERSAQPSGAPGVPSPGLAE